MKVLVDIGGWQKVMDITENNKREKVFLIYLPPPLQEVYKWSAQIDPKDSTPYLYVYATGFEINGLPLYAWRG